MSNTSLRISVDDACSSDLRLADLCKKYEIECIFYWPAEWNSYAYSKGFEPLSLIDATKISQDFEIGSHAVTHRHLTRIPIEEAKLEIADSKFMLEALFNKPINKFCPPRGYINTELSEYAMNFYDSIRLTRGKGLVHVHPNSGANDFISWEKYAQQNEVEELWCHSFELDRYKLWGQLEEYFDSHS